MNYLNIRTYIKKLIQKKEKFYILLILNILIIAFKISPLIQHIKSSTNNIIYLKIIFFIINNL